MLNLKQEITIIVCVYSGNENRPKTVSCLAWSWLVPNSTSPKRAEAESGASFPWLWGNDRTLAQAGLFFLVPGDKQSARPWPCKGCVLEYVELTCLFGNFLVLVVTETCLKEKICLMQNRKYWSVCSVRTISNTIMLPK